MTPERRGLAAFGDALAIVGSLDHEGVRDHRGNKAVPIPFDQWWRMVLALSDPEPADRLELASTIDERDHLRAFVVKLSVRQHAYREAARRLRAIFKLREAAWADASEAHDELWEAETMKAEAELQCLRRRVASIRALLVDWRGREGTDECDCVRICADELEANLP